MSDIITKVYSNESIDNGGIRVQAPKGAKVSAVTGVDSAKYEIDTYSTALPTTGTVFAKYDARLTGCPPCLSN